MAARLRSRAFSLANTCSIRLRSGLQAGNSRILAPAASIASRDTDDLMQAKIVHDDDIACGQVGRQHLLDVGKEQFAIYGAVEHTGRRCRGGVSRRGMLWCASGQRATAPPPACRLPPAPSAVE